MTRQTGAETRYKVEKIVHSSDMSTYRGYCRGGIDLVGTTVPVQIRAETAFGSGQLSEFSNSLVLRTYVDHQHAL